MRRIAMNAKPPAKKPHEATAHEAICKWRGRLCRDDQRASAGGSRRGGSITAPGGGDSQQEEDQI